MALLASTSSLNDAAVTPAHFGLNLFHRDLSPHSLSPQLPLLSSSLHTNQTPSQDGGTKVRFEEETFVQPVRKRWYIDLTDEDAVDGERQEKKQKTGPKHESEVIDLT